MPRTQAPLGPTLFEEPEDRCRFLLVIAPDAATHTQVTTWKAMLRQAIGGYSGSASIPHITLFFADLPRTCERDLRAGIARGCADRAPFTLHLDGVGHFPDRKTIYIDPVEKDAIGMVRRAVVEQVRAFAVIRRLGVHATDHPHLTIAAGLDAHQFNTAWAMLAPHAYAGEQRVDELLLLRRDLRPASPYREVQRFALQGGRSTDAGGVASLR